MKKETVIAVVLGIAAGVAIAVFILAKTRKPSNQKNLLPNQISPTIQVTTNVLEPLVIDSPESESTTTENTITVKGKTQKGSLIVIQSPKNEYVIKATSTSFEQEVQLSGGENLIKVSAYNGSDLDTRTLVIYLIAE